MNPKLRDFVEFGDSEDFSWKLTQRRSVVRGAPWKRAPPGFEPEPTCHGGLDSVDTTTKPLFPR